MCAKEKIMVKKEGTGRVELYFMQHGRHID